MLTGYCAAGRLNSLSRRDSAECREKSLLLPQAILQPFATQMVNFLGIMQNEWAGAQAFSSFDTYLAPFVKVDNLSFEQVKNASNPSSSVLTRHLAGELRHRFPT